jgi:hypothetical protein
VHRRPLPADLATHPASPLAWRWDWLERHQVTLERPARFFCALDESSWREALRVHPALAEEERQGRIQSLEFLVRVILARLDARASDRPLGPAAAPGDDTRLREALGLWSRIQTTLLVHFFGRADGSLDLERIAEAFLLFSAGALRIPVVARRGVGEPDSAYYFAFAEFALLSLEHDIDPQVWAAVLPHLVWTQEVYAHMQRPPGPGPHRFHEYGPRGRERSFSLAVAAEARERCRGLSSPAELAALHGRHCREAFGDLQPAASRPSGTPSPTA